MSNPEIDLWDIHGGGEGDPLSPMQFKKSEPHTATQWTINDILGDDPLLKPVKSEVGGLSTGRDSSA